IAGSGLRELNLGSDAVIDVSGAWTNEAISGPAQSSPAIHGGTIDLSAERLTAAEGVVLDVSGGGRGRQKDGKPSLEVGDAGEIKLPKMGGGEMANIDPRAFAGGSGGSLTFETESSVQVGGDMPADTSILYVPGSLYAERGFRSVSIVSG